MPKEGLLIHDIERAWSDLEKAEHDREVALREELIRLGRLEQLAQKFNRKVGNEFQSFFGFRNFHDFVTSFFLRAPIRNETFSHQRAFEKSCIYDMLYTLYMICYIMYIIWYGIYCIYDMLYNVYYMVWYILYI